METLCSVRVNCLVEPHCLKLHPLDTKDSWEIQNPNTGERLGQVHHPSNSPCEVEIFWGKGGFLALVNTPSHQRYFALPGSKISVFGTTVELYGTPIEGNVHRPKPARKPLTPQTYTQQATILGAGLATRFERISGDSTNYSKPAVPLVGKKSVIEAIANNLARHGYTQLIVNTYFKPESLKKSLASSHAKQIRYIDEAEPSGTAGGLRKMLTDPTYAGFLNINQPLLVVQGDSVTDADFSALMDAHIAQGALVTLGCQTVAEKDVDKFGIIVTDKSGQDGESGQITGFQEKPKREEARSQLGNTGFYIFSPRSFPLVKSIYETLLAKKQAEAKAKGLEIPQEISIDFANDIFPAILKACASDPTLGKFWAEQVSGYWSDIGNPVQYLESIHDLYAGKVDIPLPEDAHRYYQNGIVYWDGAFEKAQEEAAELRGNVVVARPFPGESA